MSNVINTHATNLRDDYAIQDPGSGVIILMASHVDLEK